MFVQGAGSGLRGLRMTEGLVATHDLRSQGSGSKEALWSPSLVPVQLLGKYRVHNSVGAGSEKISLSTIVMKKCTLE